MKRLLAAILALTLFAGCSHNKNKDSSSDINSTNDSVSASDSITDDSSQPSDSSDVSTPAKEPEQSKDNNSKPKREMVKVSIPEGYTFARIAETLETKGICSKADLFKIVNSDIFNAYPLVSKAADTSKRPFRLEGYLSPATYDFYKGESAESVLKKMVNSNEKVFTADMKNQAAAQGFTVDQIIILASMIEKECKTDEDRPLVSAVFRNRLKANKQLQSCATIKYVEGAVKPYLDSNKDRYNAMINTYKASGLPSSPICSPGRKAITAALNPTQCNYMYFFSDKNGKLYFSETYDEHQAKMEQYGVKEAFNQT